MVAIGSANSGLTGLKVGLAGLGERRIGEWISTIMVLRIAAIYER